jgi:hypothetical protein
MTVGFSRRTLLHGATYSALTKEERVSANDTFLTNMGLINRHKLDGIAEVIRLCWR